MPKRQWTDEELVEAVKKSTSIKRTLLFLGLYPGAGNYPTIKRHIDRLKLDTSHWGRSKIRKIRKLSNKDIFKKDGSFNKSRLKERIIEDGLIEYKCQVCDVVEWRGKVLSLHLDHINGNRNDDRLENLRFLCPNCHSLTDSYCNKSAHRHGFCVSCGSRINKKSRRCRLCWIESIQGKNSKIEWPPVEKLIAMVNKTSYTAAGKELGVSDNAVRKHIKKALK